MNGKLFRSSRGSLGARLATAVVIAALCFSPDATADSYPKDGCFVAELPGWLAGNDAERSTELVGSATFSAEGGNHQIRLESVAPGTNAPWSARFVVPADGGTTRIKEITFSALPSAVVSKAGLPSATVRDLEEGEPLIGRLRASVSAGERSGRFEVTFRAQPPSRARPASDCTDELGLNRAVWPSVDSGEFTATISPWPGFHGKGSTKTLSGVATAGINPENDTHALNDVRPEDLVLCDREEDVTIVVKGSHGKTTISVGALGGGTILFASEIPLVWYDEDPSGLESYVWLREEGDDQLRGSLRLAKEDRKETVVLEGEFRAVSWEARLDALAGPYDHRSFSPEDRHALVGYARCGPEQ